MSAAVMPNCGKPADVLSILTANTGFLDNFQPVSGSLRAGFGAVLLLVLGVVVLDELDEVVVELAVVEVSGVEVGVGLGDELEAAVELLEVVGGASGLPLQATTSAATATSTAAAACWERMHVPFTGEVTRSGDAVGLVSPRRVSPSSR